MVVNFIYTAKKLSVKFTNLSQDVPEGSSVLWNFGDGSTSDEYNPSHDYENSGYYRVSLTITPNGGNSDSITQLLVISDIVDTSLSNSIYVLIDTYIPSDIFGDISAQEKRQFIQKWQLYIQPLVNHCIPIEEYANELYYEALENQLIMELAAYDFMIVKLSNMLNSLSQAVIEDGLISDSSGSEGTTTTGSNDVKKIITGPTEVEYFNNTETNSEYASTISKAMQPGGIVDIIKQGICMLAERLDIYLPLCDPINKVVVPRVVNRRIAHGLMGPNPKIIIRK